MKIDNTDFDAVHYKNHTDKDFIKDQINSLPDSYGSVEQKTEFLKVAFAKIKEANKELPAENQK